jgi:hypothetical protein
MDLLAGCGDVLGQSLARLITQYIVGDALVRYPLAGLVLVFWLLVGFSMENVIL